MRKYLCAAMLLLVLGAHSHLLAGNHRRPNDRKANVKVAKPEKKVTASKETSDCDCKCKSGNVKYVRAGLSLPGDGSLSNPYNSLALAQADTTWDTLMVLSSTSVLDGGITLRPGTCLIGEKNPVITPLAIDQPTITNSSSATNGGYGVIVQSGDVVIKNIYFKDTWASAVQYNNADSLCVTNVLATGWNQGVLSVPIVPFRNPAGDMRSSLELTAFFGQTPHDGTTSLHNVVLRDGRTGGGVFDSPMLGAKRKFYADHVDVSGIRSIITAAPGLSRSANAILTLAHAGTEQKIKIENSSFHDFQPTSLGGLITRGLFLRAANGAKVKALVDTCSFKNIYPTGGNFGDHILGISLAELPNERSAFDTTIKHCYFEESSDQNPADTMNWQTYNSTSKVTYKDNTSVNVLNTLATFDDGDSVTNYKVTDNNATSREVFYYVMSGTFLGNPSNMNTHVTIENNRYVGGLVTGGLAILSGVDEEPAPWTNLVVDMQGNCFDGQGTGAAGISAFNFGGDSQGAGNAVVNAHRNNITGFTSSVYQDNTNVVVNAKRNWWGNSGPVNVVNNTPGSVDVSEPRDEPITCPQFATSIPRAQVAKPPVRFLTRKINQKVKERIKKYRVEE